MLHAVSLRISGGFWSNIARLTLRMNYNDGNTGGFCIDSSDPNIYNFILFSYVQAGSQVGYIFQVNNIASSVNAIILNYDGGVNIGNYLRIANKSMIGLGTSYNYDNFGAQFCLPRNTTNPVLSIRYRESTTCGIEDALPQIELSRTEKNKKVFGVLGKSNCGNSRVERMVINSVGEGAIWVCNSNGNIENGDYITMIIITSSDYLGYGEKQDDDLLYNYTVAKATINCDFELNSIYYNCIELDNGLRIAFTACTYHCE